MINPVFSPPVLAGGSPGGSDTHVQFNDAGAFSGNAGLTFNKTTGQLSATILKAGTLAGIVKASAGVLSALALGAANTKLFVDAAGNAPEFASGLKLGNTSWDISQTGDQVIADIGFKPSAIVFMAAINGTVLWAVGMTDSATSININMAGDGKIYANLGCYHIQTTYNTHFNTATLKTMDAGGFTLTWAETGSPTGTIQMQYLCFR